MAKKVPAKTKKQPARGKAQPPQSGGAAMSSRVKTASGEKYQQSGAPWWKAYLPSQ